MLTSIKDPICNAGMSSTPESLATISNVDIDLLPAEKRDSSRNGLAQEDRPRCFEASHEPESKGTICQAKERPQDKTEACSQPRKLTSPLSSDDVTGERNVPVKPLQALNKNQKPKDLVEDVQKALGLERRLESSETKVWMD